jgi:hypothetical protein
MLLFDLILSIYIFNPLLEALGNPNADEADVGHTIF